MHELGIKILVLIPILLLISILLYRKINENFDSTLPATTKSTPISVLLLQQIANKLNISSRRITNLEFSGDIASQKLSVSFRILDPNLVEIANQEPDAKTSVNYANELFQKNQFIIFINGSSIFLNKMNLILQNDNTNYKGLADLKSDFFDNKSLLQISKYATQKYREVPNDASYTNFFVLQPDANFNIKPVLTSSN